MQLVTGATGFLGSHLLCQLLQQGKTLRAIKRAESNFRILKRVCQFYHMNLDDYELQLEWVNADLGDVYALQKVYERVEDVYHVAGKVSFSPHDRDSMVQTNIQGTANMVNLALDFSVRKFCYVSSIAALGRAEHATVIDEDVVWKSSKKNSNYAITKYGGEREVWRGIEEGLNAVIVNPGIILGPGEISTGSARLIETVMDGFKFYTRGSNGFVDVRDVVQVMIQLMQSDIESERFVLISQNLNYKNLFELIAKHLNVKAPAVEASPWMGQLAWRWYALRSAFTGKKPLITRETATTANNKYQYSANKIRNHLSFNFIPVDSTIKDTCAFHLSQEK